MFHPKIFKRDISRTVFALPLCLLIIILTSGGKRQSDKQEIRMKNFNEDSATIANILNDAYFKGIYTGDINLLSTVYYPGTLLFGDAAGKPYFKTLAQYLDGVKNRQSPKDSGKPFKGEIISLEIIQSIAVAKVRVKMYDFNYFELLSFHKLDGKWVIVNKMIADVKSVRRKA
jgi:hypothetical protein